MICHFYKNKFLKNHLQANMKIDLMKEGNKIKTKVVAKAIK